MQFGMVLALSRLNHQEERKCNTMYDDVTLCMMM